jgi:hypothetical protein
MSNKVGDCLFFKKRKKKINDKLLLYILPSIEMKLINNFECRDLSSNLKLGGKLPVTLANLVHLSCL